VPKKLLEKAKEVIETILLQLQDDKHQAQDIIFHRCACPTIQVHKQIFSYLFIYSIELFPLIYIHFYLFTDLLVTTN